MRPNAQTSGSARGVNGRSLFAANMPSATPENPARHVMMPNIKLTLQQQKTHTHTQSVLVLLSSH